MNYTAQLKAEGHLLNREPKRKAAPKRPLPRVSKKRAKDLKVYRVVRDKFLEEHPFCQGQHYVGICSENVVGQVVHGCFNKSTDLHHRAGRIGNKLYDVKDFVALCRKCHNRVHDNPKEARALGLLK